MQVISMLLSVLRRDTAKAVSLSLVCPGSNHLKLNLQRSVLSYKIVTARNMKNAIMSLHTGCKLMVYIVYFTCNDHAFLPTSCFSQKLYSSMSMQRWILTLKQNQQRFLQNLTTFLFRITYHAVSRTAFSSIDENTSSPKTPFLQ